MAHTSAPFMRSKSRKKIFTEYEVTLGDIRIATANGEAMFYHPTIDFSEFAGTDTGSATHLIEFEDSAGKKATAYCGARGGGETLGSELIVNGGFDSDTTWINEAEWIIADGVAKCTAGIYQNLRQPLVVSNGQLYRITHTRPYYVSGVLYLASASVFGTTKTLNNLSGGVFTITLTVANAASSTGFLMTTQASPGWTGHIDNVSCKKLTDIPTTGLHLLSTQNGTTRNMATQETGFNPNTIVAVTVW